MKLGLTDITKAYYGSLELTSSNAYLGEVQIIENEPIIEYSGLTLISSGNSTIGLAHKADQQTFHYSFDAENWSTLSTSTIISLADKQRVFIRGYLSGNVIGTKNYTTFTITGNVTAKGNLNYIWNYENPDAALKYKCGSELFRGCTGLVDASELTLPSTALTGYCYQYMFCDCTNLKSAPAILPATTLASYCYNYMFYGCTSLTTAPELPATTLASTCYQYMFAYCTNLNYIKCLATNISASNCTQSWVFRVAANGTFVKDVNMTGWSRGNGGIPTGWTVVDDDMSNYSGLTFTSSGNSTVGLAKLSTNQSLEYAKDGSPWSSLTTATTVNLSDGEKMYVRGVLSDNISSETDTTTFTMTGNIKAKGDMRYLWSYDDLSATIKQQCGRNLFSGCTALTDASELMLPSDTLALGCYAYMFNTCSNLAAVPSILPATTLAEQCYMGMFIRCASLTTAPELPATGLTSYCYRGMFSSCTSLTTAPELPAVVLGDHSYMNMFLNCPNLNYVKCLATNISATDCLTTWVAGVAANGTFVKNVNMTGWSSGNNGIPTGWTVVDDNISNYSGLTFTSSGDTTIGLAKKSSYQTIEYTKDGVWSALTTATTVSLSDGEKLYVRGKLTSNNTGSNYTQFTTSGTGTLKMSGKMGYLWNYSSPTAAIKDLCGYCMFSGCTAIVDASQLDLGMSIATQCYQSMFRDCSNLTSVPALPATSLYDACYKAMFQDCTSLTTAPELPATTMKYQCYQYMFQRCTSLTIAPELPSTTLVTKCYTHMFSGCTSLNYIKCLATNISATNCLTNWVEGVAASGTFVKDASMTGWTTGVNGIPTNWTVENYPPIVEYSGLTFTSSGNSTVGLAKLSTNQSLEYSKNGSSWSEMTTATTVNLSNGEKMYVRGTLSADNTTNNYTQFRMTGNISASGNMNYVWNYQNPSAALKEVCGIGLFSGCTAITDANGLVLPATTLSQKCYQYLFRYCTSLKTAPVLPATTLSDTCYLGMFEGCSSLSTVPELNATNLSYGCYWGMFAGCTSLTTAQSILPATILTDKCYRHMFNGCTSLTTAPELPATTLATECYVYMFLNCTNLNYMKCLATNISATDCTSSWISGVSATGTFLKNANMSSWTTGNNGIPNGWTVQDAT